MARGISFGGVAAFIFADLISLPLLLIYRKYYGTQLMLRVLAWFWAVMIVAGLIVEALFSWTGLVPDTRTRSVVTTSLHWNYTTFLNFALSAVGVCLYWLSRHREQLGGCGGYAIDPVCGMPVQPANAPARRSHEDQRYWFCSDRCPQRFSQDPHRFAPTR